MKPILLDCDPGIDDALSIILAAKSNDVDLKAITTVAGNAPGYEGRNSSEQTFYNARAVLEDVLEINIPVAKGADGPLSSERKSVDSGFVHGEDGLGNTHLPKPKYKGYVGSSINLIKNTIKKYKDITWVATGPLTNVALAIKKYPSLVDDVDKLVLMGGAFEDPKGNMPPYLTAEYNFFSDPEAADYVLNSGIDVTIVPLDVTHKVMLTPKDLDKIPLDTKVGEFVHKIINHYYNFYMKEVGYKGIPLHDPLAMGVAINPGFVETKKYNVHVLCGDDEKRGPVEFSKNGKIKVALNVDSKTFLDYFIETISK